MEAVKLVHVRDAPVYLVEGKWVENPWKDESVLSNAIKWCEIKYHQRGVDLGSTSGKSYDKRRAPLS
ncbi:hypothetical protein N7517_007180 [Penicillium concentricum]|uniref:Uncharacterized protein n=1 Tax=Penicillium concentricum TaxID=293559 RepID=A0A9W9VC17_9EURO|nr:uncharacterized protein N7517_007180 [Penicillium concentricum]KAJ5375174.1 hypothetical protein N7517_007180 [Penicillium concentricum]